MATLRSSSSAVEELQATQARQISHDERLNQYMEEALVTGRENRPANTSKTYAGKQKEWKVRYPEV